MLMILRYVPLKMHWTKTQECLPLLLPDLMKALEEHKLGNLKKASQ